MTHAINEFARPTRPRAPFETIALVLQGGGALGAYQGGVYEGLAEVGVQPDWIAGISIGAINAAIIAGNPPEARVQRLREFWQLITGPRDPWSAPVQLWASLSDTPLLPKGDAARGLLNRWAAGVTVVAGAPGFFAPRPMTPWLAPEGSIEATSYYDTKELKGTLERLIDFDRIGGGDTRLSVGAVNVRTGNLVRFDTTTHRIRPEHIMASGALPPGLPAIEIDGEHYWDGGLVSNTPLRWVVDSDRRSDTLAFQVDLWSARGQFPRNMADVSTRQKEITYSSRTRASSTRLTEVQSVRNAIASLLGKLPAELAQTSETEILRRFSARKVFSLIQLIYRAKGYEGDSKDYEFSRMSMDDHWRAGYHDTIRTLRHPEVLERPRSADGVFTFDVAEQGRE